MNDKSFLVRGAAVWALQQIGDQNIFGINLHDKGLTNAVCCFGTNNISTEKLQMLSIQGVTRIDVFFDGDEAGQKASEKVKELCEKVDLISRNVHLKGTDPGALTETQITKLKSKLYA